MLYVGLASDLVGFAVIAASLAAHFLLARQRENEFLL
jgi:hypothetical protein